MIDIYRDGENPLVKNIDQLMNAFTYYIERSHLSPTCPRMNLYEPYLKEGKRKLKKSNVFIEFCPLWFFDFERGEVGKIVFSTRLIKILNDTIIPLENNLPVRNYDLPLTAEGRLQWNTLRRHVKNKGYRLLPIENVSTAIGTVSENVPVQVPDLTFTIDELMDAVR
jgi:hypothetical protein